MRSRAFDLVYLDLGGTVVELIAYEGAAIDPAPQTEHLGYRMIARDALTEEVRFERDSPLEEGDSNSRSHPIRSKAPDPSVVRAGWCTGTGTSNRLPSVGESCKP